MKQKQDSSFQAIVVGAGHAGIEAALACARLGLKTAVVTTNLDRIGYMSCNPAIGGLAKGHMVREIDFLGGEMAKAADYNCIQFKRLNAKKGPAVRGSRAQCDKDLYCMYMSGVLRSHPNISIIEGEVVRVLLEKDRCVGVVLQDQSEVRGICTVITTGTFMNAVMHIGKKKIEGGRVGDKASVGLSDQIRGFGFTVRRLKTGTPPRLLAGSIDWTKTLPQSGDEFFYPFSAASPKRLRLPQIQCYLSHTNEKTHEIIRGNLHLSPMFTGDIQGVGPRYCPSIEDKVNRFAEKASHQTFLEPEGLNTDHIYLQGISTSLPEEVQYQFLRTIPGLEQVKMIRPGYAVEYDFIEPTQIFHSLETRAIKHLFFAGQINGTSGYEEAAAQGLMAGINAAHKVLERPPVVLGREQAYIGVLIDDLVTKGTIEPYRMFTSRAEHRLVLREDNTGDRLADLGFQLGLLAENVYKGFDANRQRRREIIAQLRSHQIVPTQEINDILLGLGTPVLQKPITLEDLMRRTEISSRHLEAFGVQLEQDFDVIDPLEVEIKYSGYIKRQDEVIRQAQRLESLVIPDDISYSEIHGLSAEEKEKLGKIKPRSLGQAQRISGVNPSAIQAILVHLKGRRKFHEIEF